MDTEDLIAGERLHEVAEEHGFKPRTLTKWRSLGLLPRHVEQVGHRQAGKTYLYPAEAVRQLERLIYWKKALGIQTPPRRIGWALWCEGFDSDPELTEVIAGKVMELSAARLPELILSNFATLGLYTSDLRHPERVDRAVQQLMPDVLQDLINEHDSDHWKERMGQPSDFEGLTQRASFERETVVEFLNDRLGECRAELVQDWDHSLPVPSRVDLVLIVFGHLTGLHLLRIIRHLTAHPDPTASEVGTAMRNLLRDMS